MPERDHRRTRVRSWRPWRWPLPGQIALGVVLGVAAGLIWNQEAVLLGVRPVAVFGFLGDLFLRSLKMVIVPLLAGSIVSGVAGIGATRTLGRLFGKTFGWYAATSLAAILTGLLLVNLVQPGLVGGEPVGPRLGLTARETDLAAQVRGTGAGDLVGIFLRMVPENPVAAAAQGDILPLIFFAIIYGIALTMLPARLRDAQLPLWEGLFGVMTRIAGWIVRAAPVGIFGLMARIVAQSGFEAFGPLARYGATVVAGLIVHAAFTLPLLLWMVSRVPPLRHARTMSPALLTAFSTQSSSATLPLTIERAEHGAGISNRVSSFALPLGATVNMDGTALYECVAALFIAQAYGLELSAGAQAVVVITALLASIGAAGIPAAGLVMIAIVLNAVGLPLEGVALILAVDPLLDMCRTAVNVWSDACGAAAVAVSEGEVLYGDAAAPPAAAGAAGARRNVSREEP